jgi:hypothetical protein
MDTNQIHNPARLEGETLAAYRSRQHMSKRLAQRGTLVWNNGTYFKPGSTSPQKYRKAKA